jgi:hypothetical protein
VLASLPTAGFALGALDNAPSLTTHGTFAALTPASADPRIAAFAAERSGRIARMMRFTPAGAADYANRAVTVAVRVDENSAQAISVRSAIEAAREQAAGESNVGIAPTRYNLGVARGYQSFARPSAPTPATAPALSDSRMPDLADFRPSPGAKEEPSRFAARIDSDVQTKPAAAPRIAPDQTVDLEGSYRLTRNLDVTAGVRYSQDRNRLTTLAEPAKQDSQAVYIGTQFRF